MRPHQSLILRNRAVDQPLALNSILHLLKWANTRCVGNLVKHCEASSDVGRAEEC